MQLIEHTSWASESVDEEAGVVRGVKIIGLESKNGRRYNAEALSKAKPLYEGRGINTDHRKGSRRITDGFGRLVNVTEKEDGLYGDVEYLKTHPFAATFVEAARRMPEQLGLSHVAEGKERQKGDIKEVEEISTVHSVDVVRYPASTRGLFESEVDETPLSKEALLKFAESVSKTAELLTEDGGEEETPEEDEAAEGDEEKPEGDEGDADDADGEEDAESDEESGDEKEGDEASEPVAPTAEEVAALTHRMDVSESMVAHQVALSQMTEDQIKELRSLKTREEMDTYCESLPPITKYRLQAAPRQPMGSGSEKGKYADLREEFESKRRSRI